MKKRMALRANKIFLLAVALTACAGKATKDCLSSSGTFVYGQVDMDK